MAVSLGNISARFGCELVGDPDAEICRVATLNNAGDGAVRFRANPACRSQLAATAASAVILSPDTADDCPVAALVTDDPYLLFARVATLLYPRQPCPPGAHESAVIEETAELDPTAHIAPLVVIGAGAVVGARTYVGPGSLRLAVLESPLG